MNRVALPGSPSWDYEDANSTPSRSPQTSWYSWDETLTRIMHEFSTAVPQSSCEARSQEKTCAATPTARPASGRVVVASRTRRRAPDPQPGSCMNFLLQCHSHPACAAHRLPDPQAGAPWPPRRTERVRLRGPTRKRVPSHVAQRTHRGACGTSSQKPMHHPD